MMLPNGIIEEGETYEFKRVTWKLTNISTVINRESWPLVSPSFSFGDSSWHFELFEVQLHNEFTCICIWKESCSEYSVKYYYTVNDFDGGELYLGDAVFKGGQQGFGKSCLVMELSELKQRSSELVPSDVLVLECVLKPEISCYPLTNGLDMPRLKKIREDFSVQEAITERIGIIEEDEINKEKTFEWKISNISLAISEPECWNNIYSPRFSFENNSWYFKLRPRIECSSESMGMWLNRETTMEYKVDFWYSVETMDGGEEYFAHGTFQQGTRVYACFDNKLSVLKRRMSELAPSDVLTLACTLACRSTQPSVLDRTELKKLKQINLEEVLQNLRTLLTYKETCDTILRVQQKEYRAHKAVLIARSSVFFAMFQHDTYEKQNGIIDIPDCDPDSFQGFLEYLYCGQPENISFSSACHLYYMSEKYDVQNLKTLCVEYLVQSLTAENVCEVAIMANNYADVKLWSGVQAFFNNNFNEIFHSTEWKCLRNHYTNLATKLFDGFVLKD